MTARMKPSIPFTACSDPFDVLPSLVDCRYRVAHGVCGVASDGFAVALGRNRKNDTEACLAVPYSRRVTFTSFTFGRVDGEHGVLRCLTEGAIKVIQQVPVRPFTTRLLCSRGVPR